MKKKVLVIGRGVSLKNISKLSPEDYDECLIVNNFENEMILYPELADFLKRCKNLYHFVGRDGSSLMRKETYNNIFVDKVILNVLKEEYFGEKPHFNHQSNSKAKLDKIGVKNSFLPERVISYSETPDRKNGKASFPTTGILAVAYSMSDPSVASITTIGIDFYKSDYFAFHVQTKSKKPTEAQSRKGDRMICHLENMIKKRKDLDLKVITESIVNSDLISTILI